MAQSDSSSASSSSAGRTRRPLRWLALLVILPFVCGAIGFVVALVSSYIMPRSYESVTLIQINSSTPSLSPVAGKEGDLMQRTPTTENFVATQVEVLRSRETLIRVLDRLDLTSRWNDMTPDEAVDVLRGTVQTEPLEGTDLVRIRVRHPNPQDARDIAEAVATCYKDRRVSMEVERAERALNALDSELRSQEDLVEEKRKVLHTISMAMKVPYNEGGEEGEGPGNSEGSLLKDAAGELARLEREKERAAVEMKAVLRLPSDVLLLYIREKKPSLDLERAMQEEREKFGELEVRRTQFPEDHGEVRRLRREHEVLQEGLRQRGDAYRNALKVEAEMLKEQIENMKKVVAKRRDMAVDSALESQDYVEARREYESAQVLLQGMKQQHSMQRIALKIPQNPITIHERPRIGYRPTGPKVGRMGLGGILYGGLLGLFIAVPIAGLMIARG